MWKDAQEMTGCHLKGGSKRDAADASPNPKGESARAVRQSIHNPLIESKVGASQTRQITGARGWIEREEVEIINFGVCIDAGERRNL